MLQIIQHENVLLGYPHAKVSMISTSTGTIGRHRFLSPTKIAFPLVTSYSVYKALPCVIADPMTQQNHFGWLPEAVLELAAMCADAASADHVAIAPMAKSKARGLLESLSGVVPEAPLIETTPDGGIALDFRTKARDGILVICEADDGGAYFESIGGKRTRSRHDDAADIKDAPGWKRLFVDRAA